MKRLIEAIQEHVFVTVCITVIIVIVTVIWSNQEYRSLTYYPEMVALEFLILFVFVALIVAKIALKHY